jgi:hypothetical protein
VLRRSALLVGVLLTLLLGGSPAFADNYPPPSDMSGRVDPSRIHAGDCAVFSGTGFRPHTTITVTDNDSSRGSTETTSKGEFAIRLCYPVGTLPGRHLLRGTGAPRGGNADSTGSSRGRAAKEAAPQSVTAELYVDAVPSTRGIAGGSASLPRTDGGKGAGAGSAAVGSASAGSADSPAAGGGRLAFTGGFPGLLAVVAGAALIVLGAVLLVATERRARRGTSPA